MAFTRTQQQTAYKKLSPEVQDIVMSNETTELIANLLKEANLSEEQSNLADSEILYALFNLQMLSVAIDNIAKLSGKNKESLSGLQNKLESNIFSKIKNNTETPPFTAPQTSEKINFGGQNKIDKITSSAIKQTSKGTPVSDLISKEKPEIKKYIDNLAPVVKTAVLSPEWRKRVGEIGQKYNLHLDQISSLEYEVLFVMIGMEPEEDLVSNIQKELNISQILAGQIAEEVNVRVFQYILKLMQDKTPPKIDKFVAAPAPVIPKPNTSTPNYATPVNTPSSPLLSDIEAMADNLPADTHHAKEVPPPPNLPGLEEEVVDNKDVNPPISFKAEMMHKVTPVMPPPSMVETKLNAPVISQIAPAKKEEVPSATPSTPQNTTPLVKDYSADPYREPVE